MDLTAGRTIATRSLLYSAAGSTVRHAFTICIGEPFLLTDGSVDFAFSPGTAGCVVSFIGLPEKPEVVYGADGVQALELAVSEIDAYLRRLRRRYEFYFPDADESYFED
jgi:hypothetical protein